MSTEILENQESRELTVPLLLSAGLGGLLLAQDRAATRTNKLLMVCLGLLLWATAWKWAVQRKRRLLAVALGAASLSVITAVAFCWRVAFGKGR